MPHPDYHRLLVVFADGVGLAPAGTANPFARLPSPALGSLLGGPLTAERVGRGAGWSLAALDARLGVDGLPQSVTGQATLFTGVNAARRVGRHVTGFLGPDLKRLVERRSVFRRAVDAGRRATFANAYAEPSAAAAARRRRASVTTVAVAGAGLARRGPAELARGEAVPWDVVGDRFAAATGLAVEPAEPSEAGRRLARVAAAHDLTVYETFLTDLAGHRRWGVSAGEAITRLDGLVAGALAERPRSVTLLLTSDHGNLEDGESPRHTLNPVPLLAVGPAAGRFADLRSIEQVTPRILQAMGASGASG